MQFTTQRDQQIMQLFKSKHINQVTHLTIEYVSTKFDIHIEYHDYPSYCIHEEDFALIYLNQNHPIELMRWDFFHELSHFLIHYGNQRNMTSEFSRLQESQAYWCSLYSSMPRHIFEPLMLKHRCDRTLAELFQLPLDMVQERIQTISRERTRQHYYTKINNLEEKRRSKSLQPGKVYDSTLSILKQLSSQVGEENINYEVARLLRRN